MGLAWSLLRIVGAGWARELLFFPEKVRADEAHRIGLVTRIFMPADLYAQTEAAAQRLAAYAPAALKTAKANVLSAEKLSLSEFVDVEGARHVHLSLGPSRAEGFKAFAQKRTPDFG